MFQNIIVKQYAKEKLLVLIQRVVHKVRHLHSVDSVSTWSKILYCEQVVERHSTLWKKIVWKKRKKNETISLQFTKLFFKGLRSRACNGIWVNYFAFLPNSCRMHKNSLSSLSANIIYFIGKTVRNF